MARPSLRGIAPSHGYAVSHVTCRLVAMDASRGVPDNMAGHVRSSISELMARFRLMRQPSTFYYLLGRTADGTCLGPASFLHVEMGLIGSALQCAPGMRLVPPSQATWSAAYVPTHSRFFPPLVMGWSAVGVKLVWMSAIEHNEADTLVTCLTCVPTLRNPALQHDVTRIRPGKASVQFEASCCFGLRFHVATWGGILGFRILQDRKRIAGAWGMLQRMHPLNSHTEISKPLTFWRLRGSLFERLCQLPLL